MSVLRTTFLTASRSQDVSTNRTICINKGNDTYFEFALKAQKGHTTSSLWNMLKDKQYIIWKKVIKTPAARFLQTVTQY